VSLLSPLNAELIEAELLARRDREVYARVIASPAWRFLASRPTLATHHSTRRAECRVCSVTSNGTGRGFPLAGVGAVDCVALRHHIIDAQCNEIASAQFAIDRRIEKGQAAYTQLKVQLGPKDQTCLGRSGDLGPIILPLSITVNDLCSAMIEGRSRSWVLLVCETALMRG
jgi:hypothetical protein